MAFQMHQVMQKGENNLKNGTNEKSEEVKVENECKHSWMAYSVAYRVVGLGNQCYINKEVGLLHWCHIKITF